VDENENPIVADVCEKDGLMDMITDFQRRMSLFGLN
tara:strand:- start:282 stop:389 length:108 start_codon:yes stop_codon:yes gene_type:complete